MKTKSQKCIWAVLMAAVLFLLGIRSNIVYAQIDTNGATAITAAWQGGNRKFSSFDDTKALKVDAGYGFKVKTTAETKTIITKGQSTKDFPDIGIPAFLKAYTWFKTEENSAGKIQVKKSNMEIYQCAADGSNGRWEKVDLVMTVTDIEKYKGEEGYVAIGNSICGSAYIGIEEMTMESKFYKAGTSIPVTLKSNVTLKDIDTRQYIGIKADKIHGQYVSKNTKLSYQSAGGMNIYYADFDTDYNSEEFTCAGFTFESDSFEYTFGRVREDRPSGQEQYVGSGQNMVQFDTPDPRKTVSDDDEQNVTVNTVQSLAQPWTYEVEQSIASGIPESHYYKNFIFKDSIEKCLEILDIKVIGDGEDVTSKFQVSKDGNNVEAVLKNPKDPDFYTRGIYVLKIKVKMKVPDNPSEQQMQELRELWASHGHYNAEKTTLYMENQAQTTVNEKIAPSNKAETYIELPTEDEERKSPGLKITKQTEKYEYQAKDKIRYTVTVKNTNPKANTAYFFITDHALPDTAEIDFDSIEVSGIEKQDYILKKTGNEWQLASKGDYALPYENTIKIRYDVLIKKEANGTLIDNEASVNAVGVPEKKAQRQVYINSPKNNVIKSAPEKAYKIGDNVTYKVTVANPNPGTFMRNLQFHDEIKADGMKIVPGSLSIITDQKDITALCDITYGKDGRSYSAQTPVELANGTIPAMESSWGKKTGDYENLQCSDKIEIVYQAVIESEELAGMNIRNVFEAPATKNSNGDKIRDDVDIPSGGGLAEESIKIKSPSLQIVKASDKKQYQVGETGTYTLKISQDKEDLVAKNIVISDSFDKEGMEITDILVSYNGNDITKDCKITKSNHKFKIETGKDLGESDILKVVYQVTFKEKIEGNIVNTAIAKGDNTQEDKDENIVLLKNPAIMVKKESNKSVYHTGEIGSYQLKVTQDSEGVQAENVVIEDCFKREGMKISDIHIKHKEKDITSECKIIMGEKDNQFRIETGRNLKKGEEMMVTYKTSFGILLEGDIINVAEASSDNTEPGQDTNKVAMEEPVPELSIQKTSDKKVYKKGEKGTYTITVTQTVKDAVAKKLIICDKIPNTGAVILKNTIKVQDPSGKNLTKECKITCDGKNYRIETGRDLAYDQSMKVTYQIYFKEKSLQGKKFLNIATAKGSNAKEVSIRHQVKIEKPLSATASTGKENGTDTPKTGDSSFFPWIMIAAASAACLVFFARKRYNEKK